MKSLIFAGTAVLALASTPLAAQETVAVDASGNVYVLTPEQETLVGTWPADRQAMYRGWPYNLQEYYWTLDAPRQDGWWLLNDGQRAQVFAMTPEAREAAWASIAAQAAGMNTTATAATSAAAMASTEGPRFVSRAVVQTTPAAATATANVDGKSLPTCKPGQQDGCINSWDKNRTGNRELNYWPGKPASETPGKLPATPSGD